MPLVPQTKTEELINQLNDLIGSGRKDNEILIRRISKQSDDLLKIDPSEAYLVKGILASYNDRSFAEVADFFEKSLRLNYSSCLGHLNYSVACSYAGHYSKELEHMEKARQFAAGPRELESVAITYPKTLCSSYMFYQYSVVTGDHVIADFLREKKIDENELLLLREAVERVHSSAQSKFYAQILRIFREDDILSIQYPVEGGSAFALGLTDKLYDELLESELPDSLMNHVSIGYYCA